VSYYSTMTAGADNPLPTPAENATAEHTAPDAPMKSIMVVVAYVKNGVYAYRPMRFLGREIARASTHITEGRRYDYTLYAVPGGYRVVCTAISRWAHEGSLTTVSPVLTPRDVATNFPVVAARAARWGVLRTEELP
jgi:hypothetical protein